MYKSKRYLTSSCFMKHLRSWIHFVCITHARILTDIYNGMHSKEHCLSLENMALKEWSQDEI